MASATFKANRSNRGGVSAGQTVAFDFGITQLDRSTSSERKRETSLGGNREDVFFRLDETVSFTMTPVLDGSVEHEEYTQFVDSIADGQQFTFDSAGTVASPANALAFRVEGKKITRKRVQHRFVTYSVALVRTVPEA